MNVPYTALHFAVYESAKKFLAGAAPSPAGAAAEAAPGGASLLPSAAAQGASGGMPAGAGEEEEEEEGLLVQLVAGGTAGGLAAAATTPLDVVKTRLQVRGRCWCGGVCTSTVAHQSCSMPPCSSVQASRCHRLQAVRPAPHLPGPVACFCPRSWRVCTARRATTQPAWCAAAAPGLLLPPPLLLLRSLLCHFAPPNCSPPLV